jgi:hypothetical protein
MVMNTSVTFDPSCESSWEFAVQIPRALLEIVRLAELLQVLDRHGLDRLFGVALYKRIQPPDALVLGVFGMAGVRGEETASECEIQKMAFWQHFYRLKLNSVTECYLYIFPPQQTVINWQGQ